MAIRTRAGPRPKLECQHEEPEDGLGVGGRVCVCVCVESATFALSGFCGLGSEEDWGASEWPQAEAERDTLAG